MLKWTIILGGLVKRRASHVTFRQKCVIIQSKDISLAASQKIEVVLDRDLVLDCSLHS